MTQGHTPQNAIAIVGMAGRFPGANNIHDYWELLKTGKSGISHFTREELVAAGIADAILASDDYVPAKGMIEDADCFDADFFGVTPRDAAYLDPQHRVFLECCWHALEDAGCNPALHQGLIGVYAGEAEQSYQTALLARHRDITAAGRMTPLFFGNSPDFLATRVSYHLDLRGPSLTVQTACSTSLVAIHLACQGLLNFESDVALAGGVSISWPNVEGYVFKHGSVEAPNGRCSPFDATAAGTLPSNGVAVVTLKRLEDALVDGSQIYAVIRGTAINNDGARKIGYTAPSQDGQADAIRLARGIAGLDASDIGYVEAHGTGTVMGDPIEVAALTDVFGKAPPGRSRCRLGSTKSNLGHLKAAAGAASLIKAALAIRNAAIPPTINYTIPNPKLRLEDGPFYINNELEPWPSDLPMRAAISSFGIGGTNAHAIIEAAPTLPKQTEQQTISILPVSARTAAAADRAIDRLVAHMENNRSQQTLADISATLQLGRQHFEHRRVIIADTREVAQSKFKKRQILASPVGTAERAVTFLFSASAPLHPDMAATLHAQEPIFQSAFDRIAIEYRRLLGKELIRDVELNHSNPGRADNSANAIAQRFALQWAMAEWLRALGLVPTHVAGHGPGEITAGCVSGMMSAEDGLAMSLTLGQHNSVEQCRTRLVVGLSEAELRETAPDLDIVEINGRHHLVVAAPAETIAAYRQIWTAQGVGTNCVSTHPTDLSAVTAPDLRSLTSDLAAIKLHPGSIPLVSCITGDTLPESESADIHHWLCLGRQTVRFHDSLTTLLAKGPQVLIDIGPGQSLLDLVRRHPDRTPDHEVIAALPHEAGAYTTPAPQGYAAVAAAYAFGCNIKWDALSASRKPHFVSLPGYPFERRRFDLDLIPDEALPTIRSSATADAPSENLLYIPTWERIGHSECQSLPARTWLLSDPELAVLAHARTLQQTGDVHVQILPFPAGARQSELVKYFKDRLTEHKPNRILHLWNWRRQGPDAGTAGYESLVALATAIQQSNTTTAIDLVFVADHLFAVDSCDAPCPDTALALGPCRVIGQELPNVRVRIVDASHSIPPAQLLDECFRDGPDTVALRGNHRLSRNYRTIRRQNLKAPFRAGGHYLITGGTGQLGLALAQELGSRYGAKITLISRRGACEAVPSSEPINTALQKIEDSGGSYHVLTSDVTRADQLEMAVDKAEARFGPIHGVIHCAAQTAGFKPLADTVPEDSDAMMAAKISGLRSIETVLGERQLDVRILMSSLASVMGGINFGAYAAANAWLDAYAEGHQRWTAMSWDAWRDSLDIDVTATSAKYAISTKQGMDLIEHVLADNLTGHTIICGGDLTERLKSWTGARGTEDRATKTALMTPQNGAPALTIERRIAEVFQEVLGHDQIELGDDFFDRGGDSLQAVQVIARLRQRFALPVTPAVFFNHSTPADLAAALANADRLVDEPAFARTASSEATRKVETMSGEEVNGLLQKLLQKAASE